MQLTHDDILKIAHLARLDVPDSDFENKLSSIFDWVSAMNNPDIEAMAPFEHAEHPVLRESDAILEPSPEDLKAFQANAPQTVSVGEGYLFLVPEVIETPN